MRYCIPHSKTPRHSPHTNNTQSKNLPFDSVKGIWPKLLFSTAEEQNIADEILDEYFKRVHWRQIWKMALTCIIQYWMHLLVIVHFIFNFKRTHLKYWHSPVTSDGGLAVLVRTNDWQRQRACGTVEEWEGQAGAMAVWLSALSRWRQPLPWTASFFRP